MGSVGVGATGWVLVNAATKRVLPVAVAALAFLPLQSAAPAAAQHLKAGAWSGGPVVKDKRIVFCEARIANRSKSEIAYRVSPDFHWGLSLHNPEWRFTDGSRLSAGIRLNERDALTTTAVARGHRLEIDLADTVSTFDRLRGAKSLQVKFGGLAIDFDMDGSGEILLALTECIRGAARGRKRPSSNPASRERDLHRAEATTVGTSAFRIAEIPGMVSMRENLPGVSGDATWRSGPVVSSTSVSPDSKTTDAALHALIVGAQAACRGRFFAAATPDLIDRVKISRSLAICQSIDNTNATYHLAAPRPKGGAYILGAMTAGADYGAFGRQPAGEMITKLKFSIANVVAQIQVKEKSSAELR